MRSLLPKSRRPDARMGLAVVALLVIVGGYVAVKSSRAATTLIGDLNNYGIVNIFDLSMLLSHWGETATPTTTPTPTPTTTPSPSGSPASYSCTHVWPSDNGRCSYASDPNITDSNITSGPWVDQNVWSGNTSYKQTMYAASPANWYAVVNANTNFGGV